MFLITRIKELDDKKIESFKKWLLKVSLEEIKKIFIISDKESEAKLKKLANLDKRIKFIEDENPTSPISMNMAIRNEEFIKGDPEGFIIVSKEVALGKNDIKKLISELRKNNNILCVGYKFKIKKGNKEINKVKKDLKSFYSKKSLAYRVPWNTCIIWNYSLFKKYVVRFDEICNKNPFGKLNVCVDNVVKETEYKGMEDGLAIAKAFSSREAKIKFKLLDKKLKWDLKVKDISKQRIKLARKNEVLLNFMALRNYSVDDLLKSKNRILKTVINILIKRKR